MTIIERVLLLEGVEIFGSVTTEQLSYLAMISSEIAVESGRMIYREKDPANGLYVVISGSVAVSRGGVLLDTIGPNGSFGVWALFDDESRLTDAKAGESTRLLFVPREEFYDVLSDHVDIIQSIFKHFVQRIRDLATVTEI